MKMNKRHRVNDRRTRRVRWRTRETIRTQFSAVAQVQILLLLLLLLLLMVMVMVIAKALPMGVRVQRGSQEDSLLMAHLIRQVSRKSRSCHGSSTRYRAVCIHFIACMTWSWTDVSTLLVQVQKNQGVGAGQMLDVLGLGVSDGVAVDDDELWEAMFSMGIRLIQPTIPVRVHSLQCSGFHLYLNSEANGHVNCDVYSLARSLTT